MSMVHKIDGVPIDRITVSHLANNLLLVNVEQNVIEGQHVLILSRNAPFGMDMSFKRSLSIGLGVSWTIMPWGCDAPGTHIQEYVRTKPKDIHVELI